MTSGLVPRQTPTVLLVLALLLAIAGFVLVIVMWLTGHDSLPGGANQITGTASAWAGADTVAES